MLPSTMFLWPSAYQSALNLKPTLELHIETYIGVLDLSSTFVYNVTANRVSIWSSFEHEAHVGCSAMFDPILCLCLKLFVIMGFFFCRLLGFWILYIRIFLLCKRCINWNRRGGAFGSYESAENFPRLPIGPFFLYRNGKMQASENGEQRASPAPVPRHLFGPHSKRLPRPRSPLGRWAYQCVRLQEMKSTAA